MGVLLGGRQCGDPLLLQRECRDRGLPVDPWFGKANHFRCPLGRGPGTGHVLLRRSDLDALDLTQSQTLTFFDDAGRSVSARKLTVTGAACVTPGFVGDGDATYLVTLADRRMHLALIPIDKAYNLRDPASGSYYSGTLNGGSTAWTWQQMFADIWSLLGLGSAPTLPFTPDGTPENFDFYGGSAWEAANTVLDRLACAVKYDPVADSFSVVRLGVGDATADASLLALASSRNWDTSPVDPARGWKPQFVRVLFYRYPQPTDGSSPFYAKTITLASDPPGAVSGTTLTLADDLAAQGATGTPTNDASLGTRAAERAADWLRQRKEFGSPALAVWEGAQPQAGSVAGSLGVEWAVEDRGAGVQSSFAARPDDEHLGRFSPAVPKPSGNTKWAKITGGTDAGGYSGTRQAQTSPGVWADYPVSSPETFGTGKIIRVPSNTVTDPPGGPPDLAAGQVVEIVPSLTQPGYWETDGSSLQEVEIEYPDTWQINTGSPCTITVATTKTLKISGRDLKAQVV